MDSFLSDLRSQFLRDFNNQNILVFYPEKFLVVFGEVNSHRCRIFVYSLDCSKGYSYNGSRVTRYYWSIADSQEVVLLGDSEWGSLIKDAFLHGPARFGWGNPVQKFLKVYSNNKKLLEDVFRAGLCKRLDDVRYIPCCTEASTIKDVFGVSAKYLKACGLNKHEEANILHGANLSPHEAGLLAPKVDSWNLHGDAINPRVIKYMVGLSNYNHVRIYIDYLRVRRQCSDFVTGFSECPQDSSFEHIKLLHDKLVLIFNRNQELIRQKRLEAQTQEYQTKYLPLAQEFEFKDKNYFIRACKDLAELGTEGKCLRHCVGSYVDSVRSGREYILFLRKNDEPDVPYFTVDVTPDKQVRQIHGYANCNVPNELLPFVRSWAEKFQLDISGMSGVRYHL